MEPCLFRHGKVRITHALHRGQTGASMEPCLFRHGKKIVGVEGSLQCVGASMEPCLFRHGKDDVHFLAADDLRKLQWSHVFSDMVRGNEEKTMLYVLSFNGAMSFQTW